MPTRRNSRRNSQRSANPYEAAAAGRPAGSIGWRVHYFEELESTQETARALAAQGALHGEVVVAEQQSAGRGRMGRRWHSPPGVNFYGTFILRPDLPVAEAALLSLVAGVAVAEAMESVAPGIVALKWPNDVWLAGRKVGGIIAEAVTDTRQRLACVLLGIGINLNLPPEQIPDDLRGKATSVLAATGRPCDRTTLAAALFSRLDTRYMETLSGGFAAVWPAWERYSALTGRRVAVVDGCNRLCGTVSGIAADGALLLDTEVGTLRVLAGDVTVEGAYD
ncbi:MAG TPA: biotin--[acetyl-CoA-carboxylase] ligase [Candidatus Binataceae bacterium]|jgi:BirA family biotin operon repressor/biotin-[acetyl-CoA-carboxylase] ligase|nr:biotin--[acetyl-CoA-carboxylase] ligase [Candidatus Binataceae bacterium]